MGSPPGAEGAAASLPRLPEAQIRSLERAYREAVSAKRRSTGLLLLAILVATLVAAHLAEVDLVKFFSNIDRFTSYIGRLFFL